MGTQTLGAARPVRRFTEYDRFCVHDKTARAFGSTISKFVALNEDNYYLISYYEEFSF